MIFATALFVFSISAYMFEFDVLAKNKVPLQYYNRGAYAVAGTCGGIVAIILNFHFYFVVKEACCIHYLQ